MQRLTDKILTLLEYQAFFIDKRLTNKSTNPLEIVYTDDGLALEYLFNGGFMRLTPQGFNNLVIRREKSRQAETVEALHITVSGSGYAKVRHFYVFASSGPKSHLEFDIDDTLPAIVLPAVPSPFKQAKATPRDEAAIPAWQRIDYVQSAEEQERMA